MFPRNILDNLIVILKPISWKSRVATLKFNTNLFDTPQHAFAYMHIDKLIQLKWCSDLTFLFIFGKEIDI